MDKPSKKSLFKRWWFWAIIVVIVITVLAANGNSSGNSDQVAPVASTQDAGACATQLSTLKGQVEKISYKELEKDPSTYNGQVATFTGQVLEIEQNGDNGVMRLSVTDLGDDIWSSSDVIYVTYEGTTTPVQDDIVTVTGTLTGIYTYTSEANYQITLPSMDTCGSYIQEASPETGSDASSVAVPPPAPTPVTAAPQATTPVASAPAQTAPVVSTPPATPATWHTVYNYSDQSETNTPGFTLKGAEQKISYSCTVLDSTNPYSDFNGSIESTQGSVDGYDNFAYVVNCPTSNSTYEYSLSPGQYYLDLEPDNAKYSVTVQDYY